jgi:hypothetical protein
MVTSVYLFSDCLLLLRVYERVAVPANGIMGHASQAFGRSFQLGVHDKRLRAVEAGHRAVCVEKKGNIF